MTEERESRSDWERARRPLEREARRRAIRVAALQVAGEGGVDRLTMAAVARRAGLAASSLYTYHDGRETLLVDVLGDETERWLEDLSVALAQLDSPSGEAIADVMTASIVDRSTLVELMSRAAILMANADPDVVAAMKLRVERAMETVSDQLALARPSADGERLLRALRAAVVGLASFTSVAFHSADDEQLAWFRTELRAMLRALVDGSA